MTKIYGASDDLIEFDGDISGEVSAYDAGDDPGVLLIVDDGTMIEVKYNERGIWKLGILKKGSKFRSIELCTDPDADPYSDVVVLDDGCKEVWAARNWEQVH